MGALEAVVAGAVRRMGAAAAVAATVETTVEVRSIAGLPRRS